MSDKIKQMYRTVMDDNFPDTMTVTFGDQTLTYRKRTWKLPDAEGQLVEKGLRYGENPGQEAAVYELVGGHLALGGCTFIAPGGGIVRHVDAANARPQVPERCPTVNCWTVPRFRRSCRCPARPCRRCRLRSRSQPLTVVTTVLSLVVPLRVVSGRAPTPARR